MKMTSTLMIVLIVSVVDSQRTVVPCTLTVDIDYYSFGVDNKDLTKDSPGYNDQKTKFESALLSSFNKTLGEVLVDIEITGFRTPQGVIRGVSYAVSFIVAFNMVINKDASPDYAASVATAMQDLEDNGIEDFLGRATLGVDDSTVEIPNVDCYLPWNPRAYKGTKATTASGVACKPWSAHFRKNEWNKFPDGNVPTANFCRMTKKASPVHNPHDPKSDKLTLEPWCLGENHRYETCGVPKCNVAPEEHVDCYVTGKSKLYRGPINETETGGYCDSWSEWTAGTSAKHYVNGKVPTGKENACRNPFTEKIGDDFKESKFSEPWCFGTGRDEAVMCGVYECPSK